MNAQRNARSGRSGGRLRSALPPLKPALVGAALWAIAMAATAWLGFWMLEWQTTARLRYLVTLYGLGAFCAFPVGLFIARLLAPEGRPETRFAAGLLGFTIATVGVTSLIYALAYCMYSEWQGDELSVLIHQIVFTIAAALYQFGAVGLRLFFPVGFAALLAASLWFARLRD